MRSIFIMLGLAVILSGCTNVSSEGQGRGFQIVQTNFLGSIWNESHARAKIISQDAGQSFAVPGGELWAFGDSFKGTRSADMTPHYAGGSVSCTIAFLAKGARRYPPALDYYISTNGAISPFEYFTNEPPKNFRIWPSAGIYLNGQYYLFYSVIDIFGPGTWHFRSVGSGLGRSTVALSHYERLQPHGNWHFPVEPSCIVQSGGWLYLYQVGRVNGKQGVILARVRPKKIEDPDAYEFYSGPGPQFSPQKESAALLVENAPGQVSVAWNPYLHEYVMASSSDFDRRLQIRFLVADAPCGPWSRPVASIEVPPVRQGKPVNLVYCTFFHPELFQNDGQVMNLTYSLDLKDFDANCEMVEIKLQHN